MICTFFRLIAFLPCLSLLWACTTTQKAVKTGENKIESGQGQGSGGGKASGGTNETSLLQTYARTRYGLLQYLANLARFSAQESGTKDDIKVHWPDPKGLPFLVDLIRNEKEWEIRWAAMKLVGELTERAEGAVAALVEAMKNDPRWEIEVEGASSLGRIGPKAHASLAFLIERLSKKPSRWESRRALCFALWKIGSDHPPSHAALVSATSDAAPEVQLLSIVALSDLKPPSQAVVERLLQLLRDPVWQSRAASALSLGKIGGKIASGPIVSALIQALADPDPHVRLASVISLGKLKNHAQAAKAPLQKLKDDPDTKVRQAAHQVGQMLP